MRRLLYQSWFEPLSVRNVALMRLGFVALCIFAYWPRGLQYNGIPLVHNAWTAGFLEHAYTAIFTTGWYHAIALLTLLPFGLGLLPRRWTWLPLLLLLPLGFLSAGVQSRTLLIMALATVALWPTVPLWESKCRDLAGARGLSRWPMFLITWQLSLVYLANAVAKLANPEYRSGDVLEGFSQYHPKFNLLIEHGIAYLPYITMSAWQAALGSIVAEAAIGLGVWVRHPLARLILWSFAAIFHLLLLEVMSIFMLNIVCLAIMALVFLTDQPVGCPRNE